MADLTLELTCDTRRIKAIADVLGALNVIGPNAAELLASIAARLVKGHREHGDFSGVTALDLKREALDEHLDAVVYLAAELQRTVKP